MEQQEIFDTVARHLLTQNEWSLSSDSTTCAYRGENGTSCAVGCLIPDELYTENMENHGVDALFNEFPDVRDFLGFSNELILGDLQDVHDAFAPSDWTDRLRRVARNYELDESVLREFEG